MGSPDSFSQFLQNALWHWKGDQSNGVEKSHWNPRSPREVVPQRLPAQWGQQHPNLKAQVGWWGFLFFVSNQFPKPHPLGSASFMDHTLTAFQVTFCGRWPQFLLFAAENLGRILPWLLWSSQRVSPLWKLPPLPVVHLSAVFTVCICSSRGFSSWICGLSALFSIVKILFPHSCQERNLRVYLVPRHEENSSLYVSDFFIYFFCHCNQITDRKQLEEEGFVCLRV